MQTKQIQALYEFADFRLDLKKRRLMCGEEVVSLTPKEFDVLFFLVENAHRVVEKDELLDHVWKDTFVEEATLTRNISWLRKKLAAHAADAKIIETLPKRGYRFLPEIRRSENAAVVEEKTIQRIEIEEIIEIEPSPQNIETVFGRTDFSRMQSGEIHTNRQKALPAATGKRGFSPFWMLLGALIFAVLGFAFYQTFFAGNREKILLASKIVPFSGLPGRENSPAFSSDGKQMTFSWDGGTEGGNFDIYVKIIGAGEPVRLTETETDEINPVFSPDGKSIAFVRVFPTHNEIVLIPALGGAERKIYEKASYASLSFAPDGKLLAAAELNLLDRQAGIFTIDLQTGEKIPLTKPDAPTVDHTPRFSPDGKSLAFIRHFSSFRREIFVVPAAGGEPRQITFDDARIYGLAWNANSQSLFFTSFRQVNQLNLWQISIDEKAAPQMIATGGKNLQDLAMSSDGKTIAYTEETIDENIWEIAAGNAPKSLIRSTRADHSPQFSPDGKQIAFASDRTGNYEIWISEADGKNQRQITFESGSAGSPRFSPDGKFIAYDAQTAGESDVYIVSANGGTPRRLTENAKNNALPAWSVDGDWIFFMSNRAGDEQIWKTSAASGGDAVQITEHGAFEMFAAPDGKTIIYSKGTGKSGLWSVGTNGGDEKPLPELAEAGAWRSWSVNADGIYYTPFTAQSPFHIKFFDFAARQTKTVADIKKSPLLYYSNLNVSPDGKKILYAQQDQSASTIMLAELK